MIEITAGIIALFIIGLILLISFINQGYKCQTYLSEISTLRTDKEYCWSKINKIETENAILRARNKELEEKIGDIEKVLFDEDDDEDS